MYRRMRAAGGEPLDIRMLWALACAISGSNYRYLAAARKREPAAALHRSPEPTRDVTY